MKFAKYCPNVYVIESEQELKKGDFVDVTTKYGKSVECEVFNFICKNRAGAFYYSYVRTDGLNRQTYAQRRAKRREEWAAAREKKSIQFYKASQEGRSFLALGEPIKVGHHSEKRHRALIDRNWNRIGKSIGEADAAAEHTRIAEYWKSRTNDIDLSMPESIEYFAFKLQEAQKLHAGLKDGTIPREHSYSLTYANKEVKELTKKLEIANKLWAE